MIERQRINVLPLAARTTAPTTPTIDGRRVRGVIVYLNISARGAASGGLTPSISGQDAEGNKVAFFTAASAAGAPGRYVYCLSPDDMAAGAGVTEVAKRPVPRAFIVDVAHGDTTSYTYSLTIETY